MSLIEVGLLQPEPRRGWEAGQCPLQEPRVLNSEPDCSPESLTVLTPRTLPDNPERVCYLSQFTEEEPDPGTCQPRGWSVPEPSPVPFPQPH